MAVEARKSGLITNADASPPVDNPAYQSHGRLRSAVATVEAVTSDSIASTYRMIRVWSGWRMDDLLLFADDIGTTGAADVGLYRVAADGGAVVDADFFASAQALSSGPYNNVSVIRESGVVDIANAGKRLWEQLGLTADPLVWYDITLTLTGAADGGGTITLIARYVDGT
jgi:hypothetical protein